ncbi:DUF4249 family protein [Mucilaginibacter polytrichastri]|uniref:DUF4249 family protein n=3 Tax=Mucilaginibacter polytrichastri TaxID=1302689 RepID=UPI0008E2FC35|nr:DUF4249 family protein [Mucilaginibacter polytrichastri]SFS36118.1 protein of unknown function [Mucilaginibacter polytrichastri]
MEIKIHHLFYTLMLLGVIAFSSCQKSSVDLAVTNKPVVVGYLIAGQPISIKVYQQKELSDTATYGAAIKGLAVTLSDGTQNVSLTESAAGTYTYSNNSFLVAGKTYTLKFTYLNSTVSAQSLMPAKPQNYTATHTTINLPTSTTSLFSTDSVATTFRWSNTDSLYHVIAFKNDDTAPFQISSRGNPPVNFTVNVNKTVEYQMQFRSFNYIGIYRAILYSVNKEYIDLLNNQSGSSSQNLANIPTNVNNGLGIFTAMQADTIKLTLTQY